MVNRHSFASGITMEAIMDRQWSGAIRRLLSVLARQGCGAGLVVLALCAPAAAQFSSGSSGLNGAFPPLPTGASEIPTDTRYLVWNMSTGLVRYCSQYDKITVPETCTEERGTGQIPGIPPGGLTTGVFHFTNVDARPASPGALDIYLVGNVNNSPLTILSQDTIHLGPSVILHAEGMPGASTGSNLQPNQSYPGGRSGPGGFAGGSSGVLTTSASDGNPGFGPAGGAGGVVNSGCPVGAFAGTPPNTAQSLPLLGGSGGGGAGSSAACAPGQNNGAGGGGGGGAVLMAATNRIVFDASASLWLFGGDTGLAACQCFDGGAGSGGNLRLVAPTLIASGSNSSAFFYGGRNRNFARAPGGTVSVEGDTREFFMTLNNQRSINIVATPGAVSPTATPTLRITSIGGFAVPTAPTGNPTTPDVTFPTPPSDPVTVTLQASNIPVGTNAKVRVTPQVGSFTEVTSSALTGTAASSTATASVTIPPGYGAITASATFSCDGTICMILPPEDRANAIVEVVADNTGSRAVIVKADGTRIALPSGAE